MSGLHSMTGYGREERPLGNLQVRAEVRTVNARFLEVRVRLPRDLNALEASLRSRVAGFFKRGQVDLSLRLRSARGSDAGVAIDREAAQCYVEEAARLREQLDLTGALEIAELLALPGVSRLQEPMVEPADVAATMGEVVDQACDQALQMRIREGAALEADLRMRLAKLADRVTQIEVQADEAQSRVRARLEKRLAALAPDVEVDPVRVAQEVVLYADRMDVTEETVRLRSHLTQFEDTLQRSPPVGRKLEFLVQEIGREINTIGSKAADAPLSHLGVEFKTELEKIREQVQNIE